MLNWFNVEEVKRELIKRIEEKEEFIKEWNKVSFNYKKDGSEYQSIKKSVNNCYYDDGNSFPDLHIYSSKGKDYLPIYKYYRDLKEEEKTNRKIIDYTWKYEINKVFLTVKEIEKKLKDHIKSLENQMKEYQEILTNLETYKAIKLLNEVKEEFKKLSDVKSPLYYILSTIIRKI